MTSQSDPTERQSRRRATRRTLLKAGGTLLLAVMAPLSARAARILAVRVWPAEDYTRVTLENDSELKTTHFLVPDPHRLVVDIEGLELNPTLKSLVAKINPGDPYIRQVRVGQNRPGVVRLVFDLKEEVAPQVFTLAPVGEYRHRLIFDLYPVKAVDPIAALIEKGPQPQTAPPATPGTQVAGTAPATAPLPSASSTAASSAPSSPASSAPPTAAQLQQMPAQQAMAERPLAERPPAERAPAGSRPARMITIALDPGHGGEDPGAIGARGNREKDIVLAIAKRLKQKIEEFPNMRVMLTRDGDYFVPLGMRVQKARRVQADLFVSIHADAFVERSARGSSVFVLSEKGASSTAARWLANKENAADLIGGANLKAHDAQLAGVLLDLSTTAQIADSSRLGKALLGEISGINRLHRGMVEQAGFAVLKAPDIPSVLIETAFISNPEEEAKLTNPDYQDQLALAVTAGIRKYFDRNPALAKRKNQV